MKLGNFKGGTGTIISINDRKSLDKYISEVSKFKPLTKEEEVSLFKLIEQNNDSSAIEKIWKHNLLFVIKVARYFSMQVGKSITVSLEDLINEGNIGLYLAISKFDYKTGNKFISYAVWWIKQHIVLAIDKNAKTIRLPSNIRQEVLKIQKKQNKLEQILGRSVDLLEVFDEMVKENEILKEMSFYKFDSNVLMFQPEKKS